VSPFFLSSFKKDAGELTNSLSNWAVKLENELVNNAGGMAETRKITSIGCM